MPLSEAKRIGMSGVCKKVLILSNSLRLSNRTDMLQHGAMALDSVMASVRTCMVRTASRNESPPWPSTVI
jgi:hypothetical protein